MRFTQRQKAIILYINRRISHTSGEIAGRMIAGHLQISLRTLQNEIAAINHSGAGTVIESNRRGYYFNQEAVSRLHLTPQNPEDEIDGILKQLLLENCDFDLDELAEEYYISTSTLQMKLKKIDVMLKPYELSINKHKNRVSIQGSETQKRQMIHNMIMREIGLTYDSIDIASSYLKNINTVEVQSIILAAIQKHEYFIESCYTTNLVVNILTALSRIHDNFHVGDVELAGEDSLAEYQIARDICREAGEKFHIVITPDDIRYITMLIMGQVKPVHEKQSLSRLEAKQYDILFQLIQNTFGSYMLNINYNTFLPNFIRHIQALLIRARNRQFVINLISENIKETSPFVYDVAVHLAKSLEDTFEVRIIDEEIGLLSIYIGFIIEQSTVDSNIIKTLIICNDYKNIAANILTRLESRHQSIIDILDVLVSTARISDYGQADLIIHTIPVQVLGKTTILISPFCTDDDMKKIDRAIAKISEHKKERQNQELLLACFNEQLFFRNQGIWSKEEAIRFLGRQVEKSGLCEPGFTDSVLKREAMSSTCFMNTFAIPHAIELNARHTCFAVLFEKNGIVWDDTKINYVFMIAVCREDRKEFMRIYSGIIQFLLQKDAFERLKQATDFHDFIECFNYRGDHLI